MRAYLSLYRFMAEMGEQVSIATMLNQGIMKGSIPLTSVHELRAVRLDFTERASIAAASNAATHTAHGRITALDRELGAQNT